MVKHEVFSAQRLERLWADHLKGEFESKDVEATLATMVEDASVNHMPVNTGGKGKDALRRFYRDEFIPSWPDDLEMLPVNRVVGEGQLVDELRLSFTHTTPMPWFLPNVAPTARKIVVDVMVIAQSAATNSLVSASIGTTPMSCAKWVSYTHKGCAVRAQPRRYAGQFYTRVLAPLRCKSAPFSHVV
jgi:hypothetical protein